MKTTIDQGILLSNNPKILVVIVSFNSFLDVELCLSALSSSTYINFEVAICENGGSPAYLSLTKVVHDSSLIKTHCVSVFMAPSNLGFAGGINFLLDRGKDEEAYWILNPDTLPSPDTLQKIVDRLVRGDCGVVGHDIYWQNGVLASRAGRWDVLTARGVSIGLGGVGDSVVDEQKLSAESNYVIGASLLVSRNFIGHVGRMREDYFLYCEEVEWCIRGLKLGEKLGYAPGAHLVHLHGTSTGGSTEHKNRSRLSVYYAERARLLLTYDVAPHLLFIVIPITFLNCFARFGRRSAWRQLRYAIEGWCAGVINERGPRQFTV